MNTIRLSRPFVLLLLLTTGIFFLGLSSAPLIAQSKSTTLSPGISDNRSSEDDNAAAEKAVEKKQSNKTVKQNAGDGGSAGTEPASAKKSAGKNKTTSDTFVPSEEISDDLPVSFPVDI